MDLFEVYRERQIRITPEAQVTVKYITAGDVSDLFSLAGGDLLLVKKHITPEDCRMLAAYAWTCTVFTARPQTLDEFDAREKLRERAELHQLENVGLNYLHFEKTLLVFGELEGTEAASPIPNAVCISPVRREEIETQHAVNLEAIRAVLAARDEASEEEAPKKSELRREKSAAPKPPSEYELICAALKEKFDKDYSVVRTEFTGTSIESKSISLSDFYREHEIAQGRLTGSWRLFDKAKIGDAFDVGAVKRAVDEVYRRLSVTVPGYGRLVRAERMAEFRENMKKIEEDYRNYISGNVCGSIGSVLVRTAFSPWQIIDESFRALLDYLIEICPVKGLDTEAYIQDVKNFVFKEQSKLDGFPEKVKLRITETDYKGNQWRDKAFVNSLFRAAVKDREFFSEDFRELLARFISTPELENDSKAGETAPTRRDDPSGD